MPSQQQESYLTPSLFLNVNSIGNSRESAIHSISLAVNFNPDCPKLKRKILEKMLNELFTRNFQQNFFPHKPVHCNTHSEGICVYRMNGDNAFQF